MHHLDLPISLPALSLSAYNLPFKQIAEVIFVKCTSDHVVPLLNIFAGSPAL